jgi:hypothetical protein
MNTKRNEPEANTQAPSSAGSSDPDAADVQTAKAHEEPEKSSPVFHRFKLWKEYEGVAMHFNDLIIRLRSQSLGAVAAFATLAGVVAKSDTTAELRWGLLTGAFFLLRAFWVAVFALDLGYYNRLLAGAVDALLTIESGSQGSKSVDRIELSTKIEAGVASGRVTNNAYRITFYALVFLALLVGLSVSACKLCFGGTVPNNAYGATFYALVILALLVWLFVSTCKLCFGGSVPDNAYRVAFYALVFLALLVGLVVSNWKLCFGGTG